MSETQPTLEALQAENERLRVERDEAVRLMSQYAREAGEATGRLEMSEAAGIVDGWRERAEAAEAQLRSQGTTSPSIGVGVEEDHGLSRAQPVSGSVPSPVGEAAPSGAECAAANRMAERLYERFWTRNQHPAPTPFADQAPAIIEMWKNIARYAIGAQPVLSPKSDKGGSEPPGGRG